MGRIRASASSKTAYGTAFCLAQRRQTPEAVTIVGLTSPANVDFTRKLGCYDDVVLYDDIASSLPGDPAVYVDFSGSATVRAAVHRRLGDQLTYSCARGTSCRCDPGAQARPRANSVGGHPVSRVKAVVKALAD